MAFLTVSAVPSMDWGQVFGPRSHEPVVVADVGLPAVLGTRAQGVVGSTHQPGGTGPSRGLP